jgi:hypothetical protein
MAKKIFKNLVDVCAGPMTVDEIKRELTHYMNKMPQKLIIDIDRREKGYYATLYITKRDFTKKC